MHKPNTIGVLPDSERPRERCLAKGARCLSLRECLALVIGSGPRGRGCLGIAHQILERPGTGLAEPEQESAFFTAMEVAGLTHLADITGLGEAGRARLLASFEIGRRYAAHRETKFREQNAKRRLGNLPENALDRIGAAWRSEPQEWLGFVPIDRSGRLGELCVVERGVRTHVNVDPVELFARLLALRPRAFFLFHNHPSGDLTPSEPDFDLTRRTQALAHQLGIRLMGHGIVGARGERWVVV
jgi:DNA repair protein RadC